MLTLSVQSNNTASALLQNLRQRQGRSVWPRSMMTTRVMSPSLQVLIILKGHATAASMRQHPTNTLTLINPVLLAESLDTHSMLVLSSTMLTSFANISGDDVQLLRKRL